MRISNEIRNLFIKYFTNNGHFHYPHSPLIPSEIDTTMFTIAGMKQFSNIFLGIQPRIHKSAVTIQPCIRLGGKHNDLDMIGKTTRHNTFFEMMGNFSFYDYFKEQAIFYAFDFLTNYLDLPLQYLYFTVYSDDHEAYNIWRKILGSDEKIFKLNENFWQAGNTGPCGPCAEIFFDSQMSNPHYNEVKNHLERDTNRFLEIWNLVFIQYNQDHLGNMAPLKNKSVDTGAGLERLCSVVNKTFDNFQTDLLLDIVQAANNSKVAGDHYKSIVFLISEGLKPGNESREYILRKLIRRTALYCDNPDAIVNAVINTMENYKLIDKNLIVPIIQKELDQFQSVLSHGQQVLTKQKNINEEFIINLYQTYGFPIEISIDILEKKGIIINKTKIDQLKEQHVKDSTKKIEINFNQATKVYCYDKIQLKSQIVFIETIENKNIFCTKESCFYARGGGQEGDQGIFITHNGKGYILDTIKQVLNASEYIILHIYELTEGTISIGDTIELIVNQDLKLAHTRAHSATHIMGEYFIRKLNCNQAGSFVDNDYLRIDLTSDKSLKPYIEEVILYTTNVIIKNIKTDISICKIEDVKGALMAKGKKYSEMVRVINWEGYSKQLCGGTHVKRTGDIGPFIITKESSIKQGIRRIEAFTGKKAIKYIFQNINKNNEIIKKEKIQIQNSQPKIKELGNIIIIYIEAGNDNYLLNTINKFKNQNKSIILVNYQKQQTKIFLYQCHQNFTNQLKDKFNLKGGGKDLIRFGSKKYIEYLDIEHYILNNLNINI